MSIDTDQSKKKKPGMGGLLASLLVKEPSAVALEEARARQKSVANKPSTPPFLSKASDKQHMVPATRNRGKSAALFSSTSRSSMSSRSTASSSSKH
ncbi:hypothetical protein VTO58DRAFT_107670 [Aureobasidium pullulans]